MSLSPQPPGRKGTYDRPYSALNLRLAMASFGLVVCTIAAVLLMRWGFVVIGWVMVALAVVAAGDIVVVQLRRRARKRTDPADHSLFE